MNREERLGLELHAFVDGELSVDRRLELEDAMAGDPVLRARVDDLDRLSRAVRSDADYHAAPEALRRRIEAMARPATPGPENASAAMRGRSRRAGTSWLGWPGWGPAWAAFAATLALTFGIQAYLAHRQSDTRLADEIVASHVRSTLGEHPIDVASSDHHTVRPWLSSKLDFSPPVRDTDLGTAVFVGGRVDYVDGRPVAVLVYRQGPHAVDAFVWPGDGEHGVAYETFRGYRIAHWTHDGMTHWVVSDVNRAEFVDLVGRLSSASPDASMPGG